MLKLNELRRTIKCNWEYWRTCGCVQYSSSFLLYPKSVFLTGWKNTTPNQPPTPNLPLPRFSSHFVRFVRKKKKKRASRQSAVAAGLSLVFFFFFPLITSVNVISNQKNSGRLWAFSSRQVVSSFCCSSFFVGRQNEFSFFLLHNS